MLVETFAVGLLGCNCSIVADQESKQAIVVDPGGDFEEIRSRLQKHGLQVANILHTHAHFDHVGATKALQDATGASAHLHPADRFMYQMLGIQTAIFGFEAPAAAEITCDLRDGLVLVCGALEIMVLHTPGHSPGGVCLLAKGKTHQVLLSGDTLFRRGIGRTDLWGGDQSKLVQAVHAKLFPLSDELVVVPGHGENTTIGEERESNPIAHMR